MSHDQKVEFVGGVWDGLIVSFGGSPPMTFLVPRRKKILEVLNYNMFTLQELEPDEVVSVYVITENFYVFSHYQYAELFKNKKS